MSKTIRIVGQPPKLRSETGQFIRLAYDGEVISQPQYVTIGEGGGFDDPELTHEFRLPGTVIRRVSNGSANCYAVTEVEVYCSQ